MSCFSFLVVSPPISSHFFFFFFNDTATTEIYTLSLHDALPISDPGERARHLLAGTAVDVLNGLRACDPKRLATYFIKHSSDRKSTRLNSSHGYISYAVFCLKKKKTKKKEAMTTCNTLVSNPRDT